MIDPFTAFAALKGATEAISSGIKTGKDLINMSGSVAKWAKAEASLQVISSEKPKGLGKLFGKLTGAEQNAIDAHFRKEEAKRIRDEMREMFLLYGSPGQWERLQKEIATERKRQANFLKQKIAAARRKKNIIMWTIGGILGLGFLAIEFYILTNL
jgi:hypothetical protein|tara:strand:- start:541 stop:1008 length:468 start_codon:yes stop_codon:yes gene_type:complete